MSQNLKCEPHLGKRDLYHKIGALTNQDALKTKKAIQWIMNFSDGLHSLEFISKKSGLEMQILKQAVKMLSDVNLIKKYQKSD